MKVSTSYTAKISTGKVSGKVAGKGPNFSLRTPSHDLLIDFRLPIGQNPSLIQNLQQEFVAQFKRLSAICTEIIQC